MTFGAMDGRKMWGLVRYGRGDRDHRDMEKRRESEGVYREEVSASAMELVCPVSRKGTSNTRKAIGVGQADVRTHWT